MECGNDDVELLLVRSCCAEAGRLMDEGGLTRCVFVRSDTVRLLAEEWFSLALCGGE